MIVPQSWLQASFQAGRRWLRPAAPAREAAALASALVPIRSLAAHHRPRILAHLLALAPADRYLRFGHAAGDGQIARYVEGLDFERDEIFGIYNRRLELIAMAHLAGDGGRSGAAEFGVSVLPKARGRGYGARLFRRAVVHARNAGVRTLVIHALSENAAMLKIARQAGARVQRDGSESEACLALPRAGLDSRMAQLFEHRVGEVDYRLKRQAKQFWDAVGGLQEVRHGVRRGRHRCGQ